MRNLFTLMLVIGFYLNSDGQVENFVGTYTGVASSNTAYGISYNDTVYMSVELTLNADSTYKIYWHLNFHNWCGFDSGWFNTGKWTMEKNIIYFSLDKNEKYEEVGSRDYPIRSMTQENMGIIDEREIEQILNFQSKHPEFDYYLKFESNDFLQFRAGWDCIEEVWINKKIYKRT